jgi:hypothetical protein
MDDGMDGWKEKASRKMTTTSFTICNGLEIPLIVMRSIYPDFHIQGGAKSFSDCLICNGRSISSKISSFVAK